MTNQTHTPIFSWKTNKTKVGYAYSVIEIQPRDTPNENGAYADETIVKSGIRTTRAQAKLAAQKWCRTLKNN